MWWGFSLLKWYAPLPGLTPKCAHPHFPSPVCPGVQDSRMVGPQDGRTLAFWVTSYRRTIQKSHLTPIRMGCEQEVSCHCILPPRFPSASPGLHGLFLEGKMTKTGPCLESKRRWLTLKVNSSSETLLKNIKAFWQPSHVVWLTLYLPCKGNYSRRNTSLDLIWIIHCFLYFRHWLSM